jgi:tetratricopeptide (TPR) repeat protein
MTIIKIINLLHNQKFDEALDLILQIPEIYLSAEIFIFKGICIQLAQNTNIELAEAELCFKKALEIDPMNIDANLELAWFYFNILDKPQLASYHFNQAINIIKSKLIIGIEGTLKINIESQTFYDLDSFLLKFNNSMIDNENLHDVLTENNLLKSRKIFSVK